MTAHAEPGRGGRGLSGVIRLHGARCDEGVGTHLPRRGQEILELAGLVATAAESRAVVTLDPDAGSAEGLAEPRQRLQRGR